MDAWQELVLVVDAAAKQATLTVPNGKTTLDLELPPFGVDSELRVGLPHGDGDALVYVDDVVVLRLAMTAAHNGAAGMRYARRMRARMGMVLGLGAVALVTTRCASFTTAPDGEAATADAGGGAVGPEPTVDAGSVLASDSFDEGGVAPSWVRVVDTGALEVITDASAPSPPGTLRLVLPAVDAKRAWLRWSLEPHHRIYRLDAKVRIARAGDGEVDLLGLFFGTGGTSEIALVQSKTAGLAIQRSVAPSYAFDTLDPKLESFTAISLVIDFGARTLESSVGGTFLAKHGLPAEFSDASEPLLFVGAAYAASVTQSWEVLYDDVRVTATD